MKLNPVFCLTGKRRVKWFFTKEDSWMAHTKKYMIWWSTSLFTREMRIETPIRYHYISTRMLTLEINHQAVSSVAQSCPTLLRPHGLQHTRFPYPPPAPRTCSNSCPFSQWCHLTISSSVFPFSSCLQSFPESQSFLMSQLFTSSGQSTGASVSASASVLQWISRVDFFLGLTGLISLQSKGLSRVFSNTTVQKHQFFSDQLSSWSNSHIHTWLLEKP